MNYKGIAKGKTIELEEPLPYPQGQPVSVSVEPLRGVSFFDTKINLEVLASQQGVSIVSDFGGLLGDFWPEDESVDQFIAAVQAWRHEEE